MSYPQDFFGASPKTVLSSPFAHIQYALSNNTNLPARAAGVTTVLLNTVVTSTIPGFTALSGNGVPLPAGEYYFEAEVMDNSTTTDGNTQISLKNGSGTKIKWKNHYHYTANTMDWITLSGKFILSSPDTVTLSLWTEYARSTAYSYQCNQGETEIYANLRIWQIDKSLEIAPKAINSGIQTIAGMNTEGGIMGGDVTVSGNTLTITKCSCMDSGMTIAMAMTADHTVVLPATINQDFYIFMVRLVADGSFDYKAYTTYAGPSSDVLVDKWRFVSFAKNNGSGVTMPFRQVGDYIAWTTTSKPVFISSTSASLTLHNVSSVIPVSIIKELSLTNHFSGTQFFSYDGVSICASLHQTGTLPTIVPVSSIYAAHDPASYTIYVDRALLRR